MGRVTLSAQGRPCGSPHWILVPLLLIVFAVAAHAARAAPATTTPTGIDVSNWQGQIDWLAVGASGHAFVFAKATEGTTFTDVTFPLNRSGAALVRKRFGAYHFAQPKGASDAEAVASAVAQADFFLSVAQPQQGELLPVLDLERSGGLPVERLTLWTQTWLTEVFARTGLKAIVYASPSFWQERLGDSSVAATQGHPLWIAHWTKASLPILPGANWGSLGWTFWQWSSCQRVNGISGCVDGNRLNGSSFADVTAPAYPPGLPVRLVPPSILGSPQTGKLLAAVPGEWAGGKPISLSHQWHRCNPSGGGCVPITGATTATYNPTATDVGRTLLVKVRAASPAGSSSASSVATPVVAGAGVASGAAPKPRTPPTIVGNTEVGQTVTVVPGSWSGSPTSFAQQWRRCAPDGTACKTIAGATTLAYTLSPDDIGATLSVVVTATGKGGSGSSTSGITGIVVAAPVPVAAVGAAIAQRGAAGAVTTADSIATANWQPGTLPDQTPVRLSALPSRLALPGTAIRLHIGTTDLLPWPIDVQYTAAPADTIPGILPTKGVWQPLSELASPTLPAAQRAGSYRDSAGALHVVTRTSTRIALFINGSWGDPRFTTPSKPRLGQVTKLTARRNADGSTIIQGRITLDTQAHLYVSLTAADAQKTLIRQRGSRVGRWLEGKPVKTAKALQLHPGALPIRLRTATQRRDVVAPTTLRIIAIDPYGRRATLLLPVPGTH